MKGCISPIEPSRIVAADPAENEPRQRPEAGVRTATSDLPLRRASSAAGAFGRTRRTVLLQRSARRGRSAKMHPFIKSAPALPRLLKDAGYRLLQTGKYWRALRERGLHARHDRQGTARRRRLVTAADDEADLRLPRRDKTSRFSCGSADDAARATQSAEIAQK